MLFGLLGGLSLCLLAGGALAVLDAFPLQALGSSLLGRDVGLIVEFLDQAFQGKALIYCHIDHTGAA